MQAEPVKSEWAPGGRQAEFVNYDGDGEVYVTVFSGPDAEVRAKAYCNATTSPYFPCAINQQFFANSSLEELARIQNVVPLDDPGVLSGGIPEDEDVGEFVREIYKARR